MTAKHRRGGLVLAGLAAAVATLAPLGARAQAWSPLPDPELKSVRGGFVVGGIQFDFGAVLTTSVAGQPSLTTTLSWTPQGVVTNSVSNDATSKLSADDAAAALAGLGLNPKSFSGTTVLKGDGGVTALLQQADGRGVANVIANTANGQTVRQETTLTLTLPGFQAVQNEFARQLASGALASSIGQAIRMTSGR